MTETVSTTLSRRNVFKLGGAAAVLAMLGGMAQAKAKPIAVALVTSVPIEQQWISRIHLALKAAEARGEGVAVVNGRIVENLHVVTARRLLAKAEAIAALAAG